VDRSAREVVTTANALLRRLGILDRPAEVILGGSVFRPPGEILVEAIEWDLSTAAPRARTLVPDLQPALGAVFCGFDLLGLRVDADVRCRAQETYNSLAAMSPAEQVDDGD
jgi:hypothetical protein